MLIKTTKLKGSIFGTKRTYFTIFLKISQVDLKLDFKKKIIWLFSWKPHWGQGGWRERRNPSQPTEHIHKQVTQGHSRRGQGTQSVSKLWLPALSRAKQTLAVRGRPGIAI